MTQIRALVTAKKLTEIIARTPHSVRILDASFFLPKAGQNAYANYVKEHVPGALFFDIDKCVRPSKYKRMLPHAKDFEKYVGGLGIDNNTHVVVYNNHPDYAVYSAPRVWWTFRVFGHETISVLENGFRGWKDAGYRTNCGEESVQPRQFKANYNSDLLKSFEDVLINIESKEFQLLDARSTGRFDGTAVNADKDTKPGHIPRSVNIPSKLVQGPYTSPDGSVTEHGKLKTVEELHEIFKSHNVDLKKPVTTTCGSGVTACNVAFAAFLCGKKDVGVYDGSWSEWYKRSTPQQRSMCPEE